MKDETGLTDALSAVEPWLWVTGTPTRAMSTTALATPSLTAGPLESVAWIQPDKRHD